MGGDKEPRSPCWRGLAIFPFQRSLACVSLACCAVLAGWLWRVGLLFLPILPLDLTYRALRGTRVVLLGFVTSVCYSWLPFSWIPGLSVPVALVSPAIVGSRRGEHGISAPCTSGAESLCRGRAQVRRLSNWRIFWHYRTSLQISSRMIHGVARSAVAAGPSPQPSL